MRKKEINLDEILTDSSYEIQSMKIAFGLYKNGKFIGVHYIQPIPDLYKKILDKYMEYNTNKLDNLK